MRTRLLFTALAAAMALPAAENWSEPVHVLHEMEPCVTYRAKLDGDYLVVRAEIQPGWHTFVMDNERRANEKLAGKQSLGVDQPTKITLKAGLDQAAGAGWQQSEPQDFSKPALRWYSWGYEKQALFVTKVKRPAATGSAEIGIRGQACTDKTCKNIDVALTLPVGPGPAESTLDLKTLTPVR